MTAVVYLGSLASAGLLGYLVGANRAMTRVRRAVRRAGIWLGPQLNEPGEASAVETFLERVETELR